MSDRAEDDVTEHYASCPVYEGRGLCPRPACIIRCQAGHQDRASRHGEVPSPAVSSQPSTDVPERLGPGRNP